MQCGANGVEFDVRRCADGQLVVIHDETIDRTTTGRGRVADLTYDELRQFDAGFGEPVPLLTDVLNGFGARCLLNIELKEAGIASEVKRLVLERRLEHHVIMSAFDWQELASAVPEIPIALLSSKLADLISAAQQLRATAIHPCKDIVTSTLIQAAREAKLQVNIWTVNDVAEISKFRGLGADGIFTDFPERCLTPPS